MGLRLLHYADIETAFDQPERVGRLAGLLARLRDPNTIVTGGGDNTAPSAVSLITRGRQSLDFFDAIRPDVATFGNHDFDYGVHRTGEIVRESPQQWVSANVSFQEEESDVDPGLSPWVILNRGGERVGIIGVTTQSTPDIAPEATDLRVSDPIEAVGSAITALADRGVDHHIVLSHLGDRDFELARTVDVDIILGGHIHEPLIERVNGTPVARPGANATAIIEATYRGGTWSADRRPTAGAPVMATVVKALNQRRQAAGLDEVVGTVRTPIHRSRAETFYRETRIGNLVADAYRWATNADIGLQNAGGIRDGPPLAGTVTVGDVIGVVPFEESVSVAALTGTELERLFKEAAGVNLPFGRPDWWHAQLSGAEVVWDDDQNVVVDATVNGDPVDPDRTYTIATSDYLFTTPTEFPVLTPDHRVRQRRPQYEVLVEYVRSVGISPTIEGRFRRMPADRNGTRTAGHVSQDS